MKLFFIVVLFDLFRLVQFIRCDIWNFAFTKFRSICVSFACSESCDFFFLDVLCVFFFLLLLSLGGFFLQILLCFVYLYDFIDTLYLSHHQFSFFARSIVLTYSLNRRKLMTNNNNYHKNYNNKNCKRYTKLYWLVDGKSDSM